MHETSSQEHHARTESIDLGGGGLDVDDSQNTKTGFLIAETFFRQVIVRMDWQIGADRLEEGFVQPYREFALRHSHVGL